MSDTRTAVLIDDDPAMRTVLRHALELEGWTVVDSADGREGLRRIAEIHPDVILTDLEMPGLDGVAVARAVRKGRGESEPLLAAVSRHAVPEGDRHLFDATFLKPVPLRDLRAWLPGPR